MKLMNGNHDKELVAMDEDMYEVVERQTCEYKNLSDRFIQCSKDFSKQYAHIYAARLTAMREVVLNNVKTKWGEAHPIRELCELREEKEETCIVIGTLFKHQDLKPSILKELSDELQIVPQPKRLNFVEDADYLILEDALQRIRLTGEMMDVSKIVTGVVCGVLGYENSDGAFKVQDFCWPNCSIQKPLPNPLDDDRYVILISGLNFSSIKDNLLAIQLFGEWISGCIGEKEEYSDVAKAVRLIIAGNSVSGMKNDSVACETIMNTISSNFSGPAFDSLEALKKLDSLLHNISQNIMVDLMPGEYDPTNIMLPQRPMHYCMFPESNKLNSFNGVTNPYECEIGGFNVCGTSGQPIADILRYGTFSSQLEALRCTLEWGHIAPTAPDTLPCVPSQGVDPFIMENCPHIYFSGNADKFDTELYTGSNGQKVRLVCIPSFAATRTIAIVNLRTLDCYPMSFMVNENDECVDL